MDHLSDVLDMRVLDTGQVEFFVQWKDEADKEWIASSAEFRQNSSIKLFYLKQALREMTTSLPKEYGFNRGLTPETILDATLLDDEIYFLIKWKDSEYPDLVPSGQANVRIPRMVIKFYESNINFSKHKNVIKHLKV
ncbi:Chromobox 3a [Cichlidogyrus casuarinus]|uniref:Chromobox 3a n=1 Tax=Cichlidogyrus casuarinus TaxID=1844966 RepID=A0ABD2QDJ8_9PLAT